MTQYHSKPVNLQGYVDWDDDENSIWHDLVDRQQKVIQNRACQAYLDGLEMLNLPVDRVPQLPEINRVLVKETGWRVEPVAALISFDKFFRIVIRTQIPSRYFFALA